jgi:general secretion pathway protein K
MIGTQRGQRGFALLVVLWTVALLALLGTYLVVAARQRMAMASDLRIAAELESAADGGMQMAIFEFLKGQWTPDGTIRVARTGVVDVRIFLEDEALKLNPNHASAAELQALLQQLSVNQRFAATLAAAIVDWRTPGGVQTLTGTAASNNASDRNNRSPGVPFARLADLAAVAGMTPDIMLRLKPHLTLFTGSDPDQTTGGADGDNAVRVIGIVAVARGPNRAMFIRHIIVRTNARRSGRRYEILMSERDDAASELNLDARPISRMPRANVK